MAALTDRRNKLAGAAEDRRAYVSGLLYPPPAPPVFFVTPGIFFSFVFLTEGAFLFKPKESAGETVGRASVCS